MNKNNQLVIWIIKIMIKITLNRSKMNILKNTLKPTKIKNKKIFNQNNIINLLIKKDNLIYLIKAGVMVTKDSIKLFGKRWLLSGLHGNRPAL